MVAVTVDMFCDACLHPLSHRTVFGHCQTCGCLTHQEVSVSAVDISGPTSAGMVSHTRRRTRMSLARSRHSHGSALQRPRRDRASLPLIALLCAVATVGLVGVAWQVASGSPVDGRLFAVTLLVLAPLAWETWR